MQQINNISQTAVQDRASKRTARVIMTDEAACCELRMERQISMRGLGTSMGKSDSYISQVENGRMDPPTDDALSDTWPQSAASIPRASTSECAGTAPIADATSEMNF